MVRVVGVSFKRAGKVYYFDPGELEIHDGMPVIVETVRGIEYAQATGDPFDIDEEKVVTPLKSVIRLGTEEDTRVVEENRKKEVEAFGIAEKKIQEHQLEMKLIDVEYTFDGSKIVFYFTANGRVDFRELVKDLAFLFKTRIELKQIGVRDEAKMLGGLGPCGRPICCRAFLHDFQPVSIKMAKEQSLSLNPVKISGLCGRLMCCLKYEEDSYEQIHKESPKVGKEIETPDGRGTVSEINVMKETVIVKMERPDQTFEFVGFPLANYDAETNSITGPLKEERPEPHMDLTAFSFDSDPALQETVVTEEGRDVSASADSETASPAESRDGRENASRKRNGDRRERSHSRSRQGSRRNVPDDPLQKSENAKPDAAEKQERSSSQRGRNRNRYISADKLYIPHRSEGNLRDVGQTRSEA